jgi:hypothetical protein
MWTCMVTFRNMSDFRFSLKQAWRWLSPGIFAPCSLLEIYRRFRGAVSLMMEAANTSETSVNFYRTARPNNPEVTYIHCRENLKPHQIYYCFLWFVETFAVELSQSAISLPSGHHTTALHTLYQLSAIKKTPSGGMKNHHSNQKDGNAQAEISYLTTTSAITTSCRRVLGKLPVPQLEKESPPHPTGICVRRSWLLVPNRSQINPVHFITSCCVSESLRTLCSYILPFFSIIVQSCLQFVSGTFTTLNVCTVLWEEFKFNMHNLLSTWNRNSLF